ncbi:MAG: hypothetical protein AAF649_12770 [Verrucomicrobiota bacterium]
MSLSLKSILQQSHSRFREFDAILPRRKPYPMSQKVRKHIYLPEEIIRGAEVRGLSIGDYIAHLHHNQVSVKVSHVASVYRSFALLEMARVPVDPAYFDLVEGVLGAKVAKQFRTKVNSGDNYALPKAAAELLGTDVRSTAVESIFLAASRASVMHEGYIEAARLLESTLTR